jgi:hypothetical protein
MGVMLTVAENNARTLRLNAGPVAHRSQTSRVA